MSSYHPLLRDPEAPVDPASVQAGDRLRVYYIDYTIEATVVDPPDRWGWVTIRQDSDYEDAPLLDRPVFKALVECCEALE